jgi:DNA-binding CsgD family transcriptional regulator
MRTKADARDETSAAHSRRDKELARSIGAVLAGARKTVGDEAPRVPADELDLDTVDEPLTSVVVLALEQLRSLPHADPRASELSGLVLRIEDLEEELRKRALRQQARLLTGVERGIARLARVGSSSGLIDRVCHEVVRSCGFSRAMLTRIEDDTWLPWMAYFRDDREWEQRFNEFMDQRRFPLDGMGIERTLIDRRRPILVLDAMADPRTFKPMISFSRTQSYVAAPIILADRPIGFLYGDRYPSTRVLDEIDRDMLWAFAEGFARIYERSVLVERLTEQRDRVRQTLGAAESVMDDFCNAELELARHAEDRSIVSNTATLAFAQGTSPVDAELTPREREVLELMVAGQANGAIAERLVIAEGTVKSHVKHILRKLGAANRSEAIARYMGIAGVD